MTPLEQILRNFVRENFVLASANGELAGSDSLMDQGVIDSTGVLELVAFLEREFSIQIADEELMPENLDSIDNMVAFLQRRGVDRGDG